MSGEVSSRAPSSFDAGRILLDRYRVERVLGEGGMGVVVAARHLELEHLVAFKFLRGDTARHPEVVERFMREARAAAKLEGEHVTRVHDVGRLETGEPYMLLEHLTGEDLGATLERVGALPLGTVVDYVLQACEAVAEAHARGIIHRDLKPSNLFLHQTKSGRSIIKVLDFGISKDLSVESVKLTASQALIGSPLYMSPEQALQPAIVDARSDVWALAVVLYELAVGRAPFLGESVAQVIAAILQQDPIAPSALRPELPIWFDAVVAKGLQRSLHKRIQSVRELGDALRAKGQPVPQERLKEVLVPVPPPLAAPIAAPVATPPPSPSPLSAPRALQTTTLGGALRPLALAPTARSPRGIALGMTLALLLAGGAALLLRARGSAETAPSASAEPTVAVPLEPPKPALTAAVVVPRAGPSVAVSPAPTSSAASPASPPKKPVVTSPSASSRAAPSSAPSTPAPAPSSTHDALDSL